MFANCQKTKTALSLSNGRFLRKKRVEFESQKHSHFVNLAVNFDIGRIINQRTDRIVQKLLIAVFFRHCSVFKLSVNPLSVPKPDQSFESELQFFQYSTVKRKMQGLLLF